MFITTGGSTFWRISREIIWKLLVVVVSVAILQVSKSTEHPNRHQRALIIWNMFDRILLLYVALRNCLEGELVFEYEEGSIWQAAFQGLGVKPFLLIISCYPRALLSVIMLGFSVDRDAPKLFVLSYALLLLDLHQILLGVIVLFLTASITMTCIVLFFCGFEEAMLADGKIFTLTEYVFRREESEQSEQNNGGVLCGVDISGSEVEYNIIEEDAKCCICLCAYQNDATIRRLFCDHHFHRVCIDIWRMLDVRCPLCKQVLYRPAIL